LFCFLYIHKYGYKITLCKHYTLLWQQFKTKYQLLVKFLNSNLTNNSFQLTTCSIKDLTEVKQCINCFGVSLAVSLRQSQKLIKN